MKRTISVRALLDWAYAVERVAASGRAVGLLDAERQASGFVLPGRSMTGALADQATLGARVNGGGGLNHCHDDAELVDLVVARMLSVEERALVVQCAMTGAPPDWCPNARHRLEPVKDFANPNTLHWRPRVVSSIQGRAGRVSAYCPIVERDAPADVARARQTYADWRAALFVVHAGLLARQPGLRDFSLSSEMPVHAPWSVR
jgi:hypothetical protein